jgi:hypothetical protein
VGFHTSFATTSPLPLPRFSFSALRTVDSLLATVLTLSLALICLPLKIEATRYSETSVYNKHTRRHTPEDSILMLMKCSSQCYVKWGTSICKLNVSAGNQNTCPLAQKVTPSGLQLSIDTICKQGCSQKSADVQIYIILDLSGYSQTGQLVIISLLLRIRWLPFSSPFFDWCNIFSLGGGGKCVVSEFEFRKSWLYRTVTGEPCLEISTEAWHCQRKTEHYDAIKVTFMAQLLAEYVKLYHKSVNINYK